MSIISRGMGVSQKLISQGYGPTVIIVNPETGNEYRFGGVGYAKKFDYKYLKDLIDEVIQTESIIVGKKPLTLFVEVKLNGIDPIITAELESIKYETHHVTVKVTN